MRPIVLFLIAVCGLLVTAQKPFPPDLPAQFHTGVAIADITGAVHSVGRYYYDVARNRAAYLVADPRTKHQTLAVINQTTNTVYEIDLPTGKCTKAPITSLPVFKIPAQDFVRRDGYKFVANEYHLLGDVHFLTQHWRLTDPQNPTRVLAEFFHNQENKRPFRFIFGTEATFSLVVIVNFDADFAQGFADVPNLQYIFTIPPQCGAVQADNTDAEPSFFSRILNPLNKDAADQLLKQGQQRKGAAPIAKQWPPQFYTTQSFTHDIYDLPTFGDNTTLAVKIVGTYYYDWSGNREASTWLDLNNQQLYRTVIADGSFKAIISENQRCVIPPTGITGPLKPTWVHNLNYTGDHWLLRGKPGTFVRARHYSWDAFDAGPDNMFNYWESYTGTPMRFLGPTLEFPPYEQSVSEYISFTEGLKGADTAFVFTYPANCTKIGPEEMASLPFGLRASVQRHLTVRALF